MINILKFEDLAPTAIISLVLKVLAMICLVLTIFVPIIEVRYTAPGVDALLTFFSFSAPFTITQGSASDISTSSSLYLLDLFFILVLVFIVITILLLAIKKNRYGGVANTVALIVLALLFVNYFIVNSLNGQILSGITVTITDDLGYYLIILTWILLFISSFTKFTLKSQSISTTPSPPSMSS